MSIYHKEKPHYFDRCMQSIWDEQTRKPDEIVLVEDGPLTDELYAVVDRWEKKLGVVLLRVSLQVNGGLAKALNQGLEVCTGECIARMDTDDIAIPERFEKQLAFLEQHEEIDVVGTYIREIDENEHVVKELVKFPLTHDELYAFFAKRDPLAHPTTMFRRSFFDKVGNYRDDLHLAEDTLLWYDGFRMGCRFANMDFVGLNFRRSRDFYGRRANMRKTIELLKYRLLHINRDLHYGLKADLYAIAYFGISIAPSAIKKILYNTLR